MNAMIELALSAVILIQVVNLWMLHRHVMKVGEHSLIVGEAVKGILQREGIRHGWAKQDHGDDPFRSANRPRSMYDDDLGQDPGKPEKAAPMWMFWLMVSPMILLGALVIASQVWR